MTADRIAAVIGLAVLAACVLVQFAAAVYRVAAKLRALLRRNP